MIELFVLLRTTPFPSKGEINTEDKVYYISKFKSVWKTYSIWEKFQIGYEKKIFMQKYVLTKFKRLGDGKFLMFC